jgi:GxxExxY protein
MDYLESDLSKTVIKAFYNVYNKLGYGFLEKVYEKSMLIELKKQGIIAVNQEKIPVYYENEKVGEYFADIVVENKIIIELKAAEGIVEEHEAQFVNYLKATKMEVGLLLNFGKTPQIKRKVFTNDIKQVNQ